MNNSYGTMYTTSIASKLTTDASMTLSTATYSPGTGGTGYYEITMSASNGSPGMYAGVAECASYGGVYWSVV